MLKRGFLAHGQCYNDFSYNYLINKYKIATSKCQKDFKNISFKEM